MITPKRTSNVMLWLVVLLLIFMLLVFAPPVFAQPAVEQPASETAVCTFGDAKQLSVRYVRLVAGRGDAMRLGKLWMPGGYPLWLFTDAELRVGNSDIPAGAYSIYLLPGKDEWTFIVNANVTNSTSYDQRQDLLHARMQTGELSQREERLTIYFGRIGPKGCDMRLDYGKTRAWIEFQER
jgi:Protein of unknown function (DUF2911)